MDKKLPKVFANKIEKKVENNNRIYYSNKEKEEIKSNFIESKGKNVLQKINHIFNSNNYIYKADVEITLKDKKIVKRIIGKNKTHLITNENELVAISDIIDIKKSFN